MSLSIAVQDYYNLLENMLDAIQAKMDKKILEVI